MRLFLLLMCVFSVRCVVPIHCAQKIERSLDQLDALHQHPPQPSDLKGFKKASRTLIECGEPPLFRQMIRSENPYRVWVGQTGLAAWDRAQNAELGPPSENASSGLLGPSSTADSLEYLVALFLENLNQQIH
ncbi:MAG: hypothetical protein H6510_06795 [Acidobacteria bacterium]|nr:hypothetical protein [Acidobacteriota bacterium]MCB9397502.1 hypothetical protein [Acidobacteriota bacterium]